MPAGRPAGWLTDWLGGGRRAAAPAAVALASKQASKQRRTKIHSRRDAEIVGDDDEGEIAVASPSDSILPSVFFPFSYLAENSRRCHVTARSFACISTMLIRQSNVIRGI